ncbi:MAG: hypothetical protein AAF618_06235, partial [Pseudomonadota bacterium]
MKRVAILFLVVLWALPARAQDHTPESYGAWIGEQIDIIINTFVSGDAELAMRQADWLTEETGQYAGFMDGRPEIYLPPLMRARIFLETERYAEAATAAAPVVVAMDQPAFLSDQLRIEALHVLTEALAYGDNFAQAEPVVRSFVHAVETHLGPEGHDYWIRDALVLRAWIISVTGASDATAVRAALLARYSELPGATREEYFELWNLDLRARRGDGTQDPALLADARYVYEGLEAWDAKDPEAFHETYRMLGLIFADHADYARAEPIIARHAALLAERAPGSVTHFWTRQNLVAIRDLSGDHVSALRTARLALADLDALPGGGGKDYAEVRSALERAVYSA